MKRVLAAIAALFTLAASPAHAQTEDDGEGAIICVTIAYHWSGSRDDLLRIREEPVPLSFRQSFEGGGCERFQLVTSSLLTWHLAYGDDATVMGAMDYYEQSMLPRPLDGTALEAQLLEAFEAAWPALQEREAIAGEVGLGEAYQFARANPEIAALDALIGQVNTHFFLADSWIRAAQFHSSPAMLERAGPHVAVVHAFTAFLAAAGQQQALLPRTRYEAPDHPHDYRRIEGSHVLLRALLLGEIDALPPVSNARPSDEEYELEEIVANGIALQEVSNLNDNYAAAAERIEEDDGWLYDTIARWRDETFADFARAMHSPREARACESRNLYKTMAGLSALEDEGHDHHELRGYRTIDHGPRDDRIALMLAQAACYRAMAEQAFGSGDANAGFNDLASALYVLASARQLVQPDESAGRFRQIAQTYLAIAQQCRAIAAEAPNDRWRCSGAYDTGLAAYFDVNLQALDYIAYGADPIAEDE